MQIWDRGLVRGIIGLSALNVSLAEYWRKSSVPRCSVFWMRIASSRPVSLSSTTTQLFCCLNSRSRSHNRGDMICVAYLDFSKAFDSISHAKLLHVLERKGIRGNLTK